MRDSQLKLRQLRLSARGSDGSALSMFQFGGQPLCLFLALAQLLLKIGHKQSGCSDLLAGGGQHRIHLALCLGLLSYGGHFSRGTFYQIES
jgi:hypothetical protein